MAASRGEPSRPARLSLRLSSVSSGDDYRRHSPSGAALPSDVLGPKSSKEVANTPSDGSTSMQTPTTRLGRMGSALEYFVSKKKGKETKGSAVTVMPDEDAMKAKVREALTKPEYNVADFYWKTGIWPKIATNTMFETLTLTVISFNAIWIAIDTDGNPANTLLEAQPLYQYVEHFFCWYFSFEWYVRFCSFQSKRNCLRDAWFCFDSSLVFMMVVETWVMSAVLLMIGGGSSGGGLGNASILRLMRLLRLSRLARMLRSMPELMILIKGMVAASRSVFFTMCLLLILLYLFAIALRQITDGSAVGKVFFPSVPDAMYKLLIEGVFLDNLGSTTDQLGKGSPVYVVVFFVFVCMAALMVMNMLIGVLCEVVSAVASTEKEEMSVAALKHNLHEVMDRLDEDGTGKLAKDEFLKLITDHDAIMLLQEVGVDPLGLIDQADTIFTKEEVESDEMDEDGGPIFLERELEFHEFVSVVLAYRDSKSATQKDLKEMQRDLMNEMDDMKSMLRVCMSGMNLGRRGAPSASAPYLQRVKGSKGSSWRSSSVQDESKPDNTCGPDRRGSISVHLAPDILHAGARASPKQSVHVDPPPPSAHCAPAVLCAPPAPAVVRLPETNEILSDVEESSKESEERGPELSPPRAGMQRGSSFETRASSGNLTRNSTAGTLDPPQQSVEARSSLGELASEASEVESALRSLQDVLLRVRRPQFPGSAVADSERDLQDLVQRLCSSTAKDLESVRKIRAA